MERRKKNKNQQSQYIVAYRIGTDAMPQNSQNVHRYFLYPKPLEVTEVIKSVRQPSKTGSVEVPKSSAA